MFLISVLHWTLRLMLYTIFFSLVLPPPLVVSLYLPTFTPTLCTSTSIRSFVYIHYPAAVSYRTLYNMLSSISALACLLLASQAPSCRALLDHSPKAV
ncbi:hypothetical protein EDB92DRAFT_1220314 [Lactarius akahatsu]|uniref:Uncharacterized protein n=1 Tax=Lactarius akahatsu TaxID=416441 RepID=A0AAD4LFS9_9AGAM|nr:hypothetical protein EDB92DRAFT_1220314 [Lactarius akahatsu]